MGKDMNLFYVKTGSGVKLSGTGPNSGERGTFVVGRDLADLGVVLSTGGTVENLGRVIITAGVCEDVARDYNFENDDITGEEG